MSTICKRVVPGLLAAVFAFTGVCLDKNIQPVEADVAASSNSVLTSSEIDILGYQIRYNLNNDDKGVAFRTITKTPAIGDTVESEGRKYKIAKIGIIFTMDPDTSGMEEKTKLSEDYTVLDENSLTGEVQNIHYIGRNTYNGQQRTYGYICTENGRTDSHDAVEEQKVAYTRTITNMDKQSGYVIHVRAFVVAEDGTLIYGEDINKMSVAKIADKIYKNGKGEKEENYDYLYNAILHSDTIRELYEKNDKYPYYYKEKPNHDWSPIVKPQ